VKTVLGADRLRSSALLLVGAMVATVAFLAAPRAAGDAAGHTCWFWGVRANGDALNLSFYTRIIATLRSPSDSGFGQCVALGRAVGASVWGTRDFEGNC